MYNTFTCAKSFVKYTTQHVTEFKLNVNITRPLNQLQIVSLLSIFTARHNLVAIFFRCVYYTIVYINTM